MSHIIEETNGWVIIAIPESWVMRVQNRLDTDSILVLLFTEYQESEGYCLFASLFQLYSSILFPHLFVLSLCSSFMLS